VPTGSQSKPARVAPPAAQCAQVPEIGPVRRDVVVAGSRLETCRFGPPHLPLRVVLLHEGLGSVAAWRDFPLRLARQIGEPVLAYSRVGYGDSAALPGVRDMAFMHHEAQVVLPALLSSLGIAQPILVGHSDGASIALIHAGSFDGRALPGGGDMPEPRPLGIAVLAPHLFVEAVTIDEIAKVDAAFDESGLAARLSRYHRDPVATFRSWSGAWLSKPFLQWNIEDRVAAIRCPLLAIQGRQDQYGTARQVERIGQLQPRAKTLLLDDCRHSPHQDQPIAVLAALTGFIAGLAH
jgi:pimeloyl-ACP methyl ester carboxylesterase